LNAIACPTSTRCIAVGADINANGKSAVVSTANAAATVWSGSLAFHSLTAVACAMPTDCVALATAAVAEVTVANGAARVVATLHPPTGIAPLGAIACPSATECFGVGWEGTEGHSKALLARLSATGALLGTTLEASRSGFADIACPSATRCLLAAANLSHPEMIQQLDNGHLGASHLLPPPVYVQALACYKTVACYALAGKRTAQKTNLVYAVNPATGAIGSSATIGGGFSGDGIACPSATQCIVTGFVGPNRPAIATLTRGRPGVPRAVGGTGLSGIGCTDAAVCFGVGQEHASGLVERV
jgi:hypothetical protein